VLAGRAEALFEPSPASRAGPQPTPTGSVRTTTATTTPLLAAVREEEEEEERIASARPLSP